MEILYVLIAIVAVVALFAIAVYNSLITLRNKVDEGWADIDTQLKRRWDLIPNMVETVKGYAKHEEKVFIQVTEARSNAMQAQTPEEHAKAENMLTSTLKSLFAIAENYPELKANQNFMDLQATLREVEEHIQMSRRYYNGTVRDFNTKLQVFPNNVIAGFLGFKKRDFFEIDDEERKNVKVSFNEDKGERSEPSGANKVSEAETKAPATPKVEEPKEEAPAAPAPEVTAAAAPEPKAEDTASREAEAGKKSEEETPAAPAPEEPEIKPEPEAAPAAEAPAKEPAPEEPAEEEGEKKPEEPTS